MNPRVLTGGVLVAGFIIFLIGAAAWRLAYERPLAEALRLIHVDRRRRVWIHIWMMVALFVTPAGIAGVTVLSEGILTKLLAAMAAVVYALGAVCLTASLAFRLTVVPWAAERTMVDGTPPAGFAAFDAWAGSLYVVHMTAAYASFAILGAAILSSSNLPTWLGWLGVGWGATFVGGFVLTRFSGPFNPPILAHTYTAVLGTVLLAG